MVELHILGTSLCRLLRTRGHDDALLPWVGLADFGRLRLRFVHCVSSGDSLLVAAVGAKVVRMAFARAATNSTRGTSSGALLCCLSTPRLLSLLGDFLRSLASLAIASTALLWVFLVHGVLLLQVHRYRFNSTVK
jgi:hypothetical protein